MTNNIWLVPNQRSSESISAVGQCEHLIRQNRHGNSKSSKAAALRLTMHASGHSDTEIARVARAAFGGAHCGGGGNGTFEYLCRGGKMSR
jgi:hypothetical protein